VASLGATVTDLGPWFGQFQLRYFGPRSLDENKHQRSRATTLAYLRADYKVNSKVKVAVDARHRLLLCLAPEGRTRRRRQRHPSGRTTQHAGLADRDLLIQPSFLRTC